MKFSIFNFQFSIKQHYLLLALIIFIFLLTRLYKISEIPPSLYWDEASIGYNAYAIVQTGRDEWGDFLPLHFRAFGEFKLPVYIYATAIFVKIFGLNESSVRIPSVLFSLGVVILTYVLARKLTGNLAIGLWSSFFVTISPWFFIFSRTGYEATAGLMFYLLAVYLFLFTSKKGIFLFLSTISFILSAYSYNSFRVIIPPTILTLLILEWHNLRTNKDKIIIPLVLSFIFIILSLIPIFRLYKYDAGSFRLQVIGVKNGYDLMENYIAHFSPAFLINGDKNLRSQQSEFGQTNLAELILFVTGLLYIIKANNRYRWLPLMLFLLGPIPAALTREAPHALRAISVVPFIAVISATGVYFLSQKVKQKYFVSGILVIIFLALFINYLINFIKVYPVQSSKDWQYGYKKIFTDPKLQPENKDRILISEKQGQPYIFALFYLKYDPEKFRAEVVRNSVDKWGFSTVKSFGKFEFGE